MKAYLNFEGKLFLKNPKNKLMFLVFFVFLLLIVFFIYIRDVGNIEHTVYREMNSNRIAVGTLSASTYEDPEQSGFFDKIYSQQQLVARQDVALRFENDEWLTEASLELAELQIELHDYEQLDELNDDLQEIVPSMHQAQTNRTFFSYIEEESLPIMENRESAAGFLMTFFESFGIAAFLFLLLFSGSIISADFEHQTMVKGYPLTYERKTASKIAIYTVASFLSIVVLTAAFTGGLALLTETGHFNYPMVLYQSGSYDAVSLSAYAIRYFLYLFVLSLHVISLAAFLNTLTRNMYATLFAGLFLYALPFFIQIESAVWQWLPVQFYNVYHVLSGESAYLTGQSDLSYLYGIGNLLIWGIGFIACIYMYQSIVSQKTQSHSKTAAIESA